jgi:hypothetical protein
MSGKLRNLPYAGLLKIDPGVTAPLDGYPHVSGSTRRNPKIGATVIVVGIILLVIGYFTGLSILYTIGGILLVIGIILWILGAVGRPVAGRKVWF